jgi:hypothetical protein
MRDRISVIGEIKVELIKKHGVRHVREENLVTGFGRSAIAASGLATIFTDVNQNKITYGPVVNPDLSVSPSTYYPLYQRGTPNGKVVNLLLNQPTLQPGQGIYKPGSELVAFAYAASATVANEGTTAELKDGTSMKKRLTRRFAYGSSITGTFDTIATSLVTPTGNVGYLADISHYIDPVKTVVDISVRYIKSGKLQLLMSDNSVLDYDLTTGIYAPSAEAFPVVHANDNFLVSMTEIGDYVYEIRGFRASSSSLKIYGYDSTGTNVYTSGTISNLYGYSFSLYYSSTTNKYYITSANTSDELVLNSAGLITAITTTSDTVTNPSPARLLCGKKEDNIYIGANYIYSNITDGTGSRYSSPVTPVFMYNGRMFSAQLTEIGNLISYHTFSVPFIKDAGDVLYVSYSYFID